MFFTKGLVSVIIPTYNRSGLITRVLDSVWNQTYRPIELLIVNDGSTDNTEAIVSSWISNHSETPNFKTILIRQNNSGGCVARNNGLDNAHGEFIQFFDDDDELYPETIARHVDNLNIHPEIFSSLAQASYISIKGTVYTVYRLGMLDGRTDFVELVKNLPSPSFILFRHSFLKKNSLHWDEKLPCAQDTDFMVQTLLFNNTFFSINYISSKIYFHTGTRVSNGLIKFSSENFRNLLEKWFSIANTNGRNDDTLKEGFSYLVFFRIKKSAMTGNKENYTQLCKIAKEYGCDTISQVKFAEKHSIRMYKFRIFFIRFINLLRIFGNYN
ncbi:MAG: glycosyltransferase family 2 protein [Lentisphaeria bacterium]|nr:glycosyltransferase family 2 protein [Lentisphaeria bacterium]